MKCYNITLSLSLLLSSTIAIAEPKTDYQFCQERTLAVFRLYTKLEQGLPLSELPSMKLAKRYQTELKVVEEWWSKKLGDKMDLVLWHQEACMKTKPISGEKVVL